MIHPFTPNLPTQFLIHSHPFMTSPSKPTLSSSFNECRPATMVSACLGIGPTAFEGRVSRARGQVVCRERSFNTRICSRLGTSADRHPTSTARCLQRSRTEEASLPSANKAARSRSAYSACSWRLADLPAFQPCPLVRSGCRVDHFYRIRAQNGC